MPTGQLYCHIIPLVLLLVDGNFHLFHYSVTLFYAMFRLHAAVVFLLNSSCYIGSSPIDVTDPQWELYVMVQKKTDQQGEIQCLLLGFTAVYRFYHYRGNSRLRLGQVCYIQDIH